MGQRQLFLDGHGIVRIEHLTRTMHEPEKKGAVLRSHEHFRTSAGPVIWDPGRQIWKTWGAPPEDIASVVAYYESDDGLHWRKPIVGQVEYRGSKENNFVGVDLGKDTGRFNPGNVVYDPNDPDPARRYKCAMPPHGFGVSPDGIDWTGLPIYVRNEDSYTFALDDQEGLFILAMREGKLEDRRVTLSTSTDFQHWTEPELIFRADDLDQQLGREAIERQFEDPTLQSPEFNVPETYNAQVYVMKIFRYESLYIGMPMFFYRSAQVPPDWEGFRSMDLSPSTRRHLSRNGDWTGIHVVQLACSRDLRTWERLGDRKHFLAPSRLDGGAYDTLTVGAPSQPVVRGDQLWFYYLGQKSYAIIGEELKDQGAGCLAVLRRDGFMSLDAGNGRGAVTTEPFTLRGARLSVNVDARRGALHVEALHQDGRVAAKSAAVTGDHPNTPVCWEAGRPRRPERRHGKSAVHVAGRAAIFILDRVDDRFRLRRGATKLPNANIRVGSTPRFASPYKES